MFSKNKPYCLTLLIMSLLLCAPTLVKTADLSHISDICIHDSTNSDCELGGADLDCEESDKLDAQGDKIKYCVCSTPTDCNNEYGIPAAGAWDCSNGAAYTYELNYCYNTQTSEVRTPIGINKDVSVPSQLVGAVFDSPVTRAILLDEVKTFKPTLQIRIPGLEFSDLEDTIDSEGFLHIPWIGEFLKTIYNFGLVIVSIIAVVMIIMQGAKIVVTAGQSKMEGYKRIAQIAIGLIIAWGSYAILYTINPALVQFKSLKVKYIVGEPLNREPPEGTETNEEDPRFEDDIQSTTSQTNSVAGQILNRDGVDCAAFTSPTCSIDEIKNLNNKSCRQARNQCQKQCIQQLPEEKRSKLDGNYNPTYLGLMDCNVREERPLNKIKYIVLHEGGPTGGIPNWWGLHVSKGKDSAYASHYFIVPNGTIYQVVSEKFTVIQSRKSTNGIGIDLKPSGCSNRGGGCVYTTEQYTATKKLIQDIEARLGRKLNIVGHCELNDPNQSGHVDPRTFDWTRIGENNDTHWRGKCVWGFGKDPVSAVKPDKPFLK